MTQIEQLTEEIYRAIDQFEKETGLLISSIHQNHEIHNGIPVVLHREIKLSTANKNPY